MNAVGRTLPLIVALVAAGCGDDPKTAKPDAVKQSAPEAPAAKTPEAPGAKAPETRNPTPVKREMQKFEPLTASGAANVLHLQLEQLGADDVSRQTLLYLADLGDRSAVEKIHATLLAVHDGKYDDVSAAALGVEALLAYGEPGAAAKAIEIAKQYAADDQPVDEWLIHALARVAGDGRAEAVAELLKAAQGDDEDVAALAVEALAKTAAPEAHDAFAKIAADAKLGGQIRAAAVVGLLRIHDPKAVELADKLVHDATKTDAGNDGPQADEVIKGFGVEGAVEAGPYVKKTLDAVLVDNNFALLEGPQAASALARIYSQGGPAAELIPWLRELAKRDDAGHEDEASLALWALGDDSAAKPVATQLEGMVAGVGTPSGMDPAVEILDIAARRGVAATPPFRAIVDTAAQVKVTDPKRQGVDLNVVSLNLAAAHAFLKSTPK